MRALLLSTDHDPLDPYGEALRDAGYDVVRCFADAGPSFPCIGLTNGRCPLDANDVDVAVDVRQHPWPNPTLRETGVTCALRAGVPVVVMTDSPHPFANVGADTVAAGADVVGACDDAIADALEPLRAAAAAEVGAVFARHGHGDDPFAVRVERQDGRLHLRIVATVSKALGAVAATRAAVAVRQLDDRAGRLSIEVVPAR